MTRRRTTFHIDTVQRTGLEYYYIFQSLLLLLLLLCFLPTYLEKLGYEYAWGGYKQEQKRRERRGSIANEEDTKEWIYEVCHEVMMTGWWVEQNVNDASQST